MKHYQHNCHTVHPFSPIHMAFDVCVPSNIMKSLFFLVLTFTLVTSARILDETNSPGTTVTGSSGIVGSPGATGSPSITGPVGAGSGTGAGLTGTTSGNGVIGGIGTNGASGTGFTGGSGTNGVTGGAGGAGVTGAGSGTGAGFTGTTSGNGVIGGIGTNGASGAGFTSGSGTNGVTGGAGGAGVTGASGTNGFIGGAGTSSGVSGTNGAIGGAGTSSGGTGARAFIGSGNELSFFMHDILGGTNPTAKLITGVVNNPAINGQIPFAKPNGAVLSVDNGVPTDSSNNALINNNNLPFLTGLSGTTSNIMQNNNGNIFNNGGGNNNVPITNGGQLAAGSTLQKLMFGTITVIDDELTEGYELGSGLVGRAQGFYVASSVDGTSNTMAFTALFQGGGYVDSLSLFGIHRSAVAENQLAVMGGTGKFVNAQGFATVKTYPASASSRNTDGLETLLQCTVYLSL